jgi:hypothetical protein
MKYIIINWKGSLFKGRVAMFSPSYKVWNQPTFKTDANSFFVAGKYIHKLHDLTQPTVDFR